MHARHVTAIGQALAAARVDEVGAIHRMLGVVLDATGALEARLLLLQNHTVEIWRLRAGGDVTLAVALDGGDDGFADWRAEAEADGTRAVLTAALPLAPGVDAGLLAVEVPAEYGPVNTAADELEMLALHAASVAALGRADLERRIAVSAATNDDKLVKARQQAQLLQRRAKWASTALHLSVTDHSFAEDAATHVAALAELADDLLTGLNPT